MIGWLSGQIIDKQQPGKIVIDINGVGYDVETSLMTFFQLESMDKRVGLHIHTVVREDAFLLYGFLEKKERALFRALIKVNGVGPKLAMAVLSSMTPDEFLSCIHQQQVVTLTKLPGVGKKTAERLVIEMKDSVQNLGGQLDMPSTSMLPRHQDEAICALEALGYKHGEAHRMIQSIDDGQKNCEDLIREALRNLAVKQGL